MTECQLIVLEKSGDGFSARVPSLPGCRVVAETREEALRLIREAIEVRTAMKSGPPEVSTAQSASA